MAELDGDQGRSGLGFHRLRESNSPKLVPNRGALARPVR
jgi:hypothetical protein